MAESIIDKVVAQSINSGVATEAVGQAASRTRAWDNVALAIGTSQVVNLGHPDVLTAQGIRMLNGTPTTAPLQAPLPQ